MPGRRGCTLNDLRNVTLKVEQNELVMGTWYHGVEKRQSQNVLEGCTNLT